MKEFKYLKMINDPNIIIAALRRDAIYQNMYSMDEFNLAILEPLSYYGLVMNEEKQILGLLIFRPESSTAVSFHGGAYIEHRGKGAPYVIKALKEVKEAFPHLVFFTKLVEGNIASKKFVEKLGCELMFRLEGADGDDALLFYKWSDK